MHAPHLRRRRLLAGVTALAALAPAAPAFAGIWTAAPSGTTDEISAIDYVSSSRIVYATTSGKVLEGAPGAGSLVNAFPGRQFFDIAVNPAGTRGLAVADSGKLYRSTAPGAWSEVSLANTTYGSSCNAGGAPYAKTKAPTANLLGVAWASDAVAYVVSAERGQVLKTTDGGATWTEASQQADGTCRVNAKLTDVGAVTGSADDVYFVDDSFGGLWRTADGLATPAARRAQPVNCFDVQVRLAVDPAAGSRVLVSAACDSTLHQGFTADSGSTSAYTKSAGGRIRGSAAGPGVFVSVGDAGKIEQTLDGSAVYQQPADGALATTDWRAVDLLDATHAAVGGTGGSLLLTSAANTLPSPATTTPPSTTPPTTTPPPTTKRPKPRLASATEPPLAGRVARVRGRSVVFRVKGKLGLPKGLSRSAACKGTMGISVSKGKQRLKTRTVKVDRKCGYATTLRVKRTKVGRRTTRLTLKVAFRGNAVLSRLSSSYRVRIRR